MSIVEIANEALKGVKKLSEEKYAITKLSKVIRLVAAIILITILFNDKLNLGISFLKDNLNLWDDGIRSYLNSYVYWVVGLWMAYKIFSRPIRILCIRFDNTESVKSLPVLFTLYDFIDFICSLYFLAYAINQFIEINYIIIDTDIRKYVIAGVYLAVVFVNWLYLKNSNNWYCIHRKYTNYYDVNNRRISEDANVIYCGKLYQVCLCDVESEIKKVSKKMEWRLVSRIDKDYKSLEEAAKDREGNLTVVSWNNLYGSDE